MPMTSDAKSVLSKTIRALRSRLLDDLHASTEGAYRLSLKARDAKLGEAARMKRERLESWVAEQVRALPKKEQAGASGRFRLEVEKEAASTLLNRIVFLRLLEASDGLRAEKVATGGWESRGYKDFREFAPELVRRSESEKDESEGYAQLLQLIFDDLAIDLPGLYGSVGLTALIPVPAATLRAVVEALDAPELESCWTDDMTLGWIYQYWNDPEREALDAKLNDGGKVEPHEIASKTQMFTERYMVDWLLQNSLGPMWLAMCNAQGWKPEVEADGTLARLEERRIEWRAKRDAEEVSLTELMPLESAAEQRWAYYVPQPIPDDAVKHANESVRDLKILDPAVGSGHFLVVTFDLLAALYREEARHRGEEGEPQWSERAIVERILEHNLHGIDLDPRAVQIAAAALWLKAQQTCVEAHPRQLNLVASNLQLSSLSADDPARRELREEVERETGIPAELTQRLVDALAGADHLGSLLKIDAAVDEAIAECEELLSRPDQAQGELFSDGWKGRRISIDVEEAKATLLSRLELFLHAHSHGDDLGLKLKGEQLAAGVRFVRLVQEGAYDLVVGNPPYQGARKLADPRYIARQYPLGKADLYAAFLLRGLQLVRDHGLSAMLTMRNWMFLRQLSDLRAHLLERFDLRVLGDFDRGAFEEISSGSVVSVAASVWQKTQTTITAIAIRPSPIGSIVFDVYEKRAAVLCHVGRREFQPSALAAVPEWPLVYWWDDAFLQHYSATPKLGSESEVRQGMATSNNSRFLRKLWEVDRMETAAIRTTQPLPASEPQATWVPYVKGASGKVWFEPFEDLLLWRDSALEKQVVYDYLGSRGGGNGTPSREYYFKPGISYSTIGWEFRARIRRYRSVFDVSGSSVFPRDVDSVAALMNSSVGRRILVSLNPTVNFQTSDIRRLPLFPVPFSRQIVSKLEEVFCEHELHREPSFEFKTPGPSPWRQAQVWAQFVVDRREGEPLPAYIEELDPAPPTDHLTFALGVALGRFGADGEGILDSANDDLSKAFPSGICFLDGGLEKSAPGDSLGHSAAKMLHAKWAKGSCKNNLTF